MSAPSISTTSSSATASPTTACASRSIAHDGNTVQFDVSRETLNCTVGLADPGEVNLEKALRLADRLGGHLVTGHVDGIGEVQKFDPVGESHELVIRAPAGAGRLHRPEGLDHRRRRQPHQSTGSRAATSRST